jgi:class 3 adenylate cyclase
MPEKKMLFLPFLPAGLLIPFFIVFALGSCVNKNVFIPRGEKGVLDLRAWDFAAQQPLPLNGEWEFYWQQLLPPLSGDTGEKPLYVELPDHGLWQNIKAPGGMLPDYGYATYRLVLEFRKDQGELALKVPEIFSSGRIIVNGTEIFHAGVIGTDAKKSRSFYKTGIAPFTPVEGNNEILIQVSNFNERRGGINRHILIGQIDAIQTRYIRSLAIDLILFASLLTIGLYHLSLFVIRRKDRSPLWFGYFCLIIALRTLLYGERFLFNLFPALPWEFFNRLDHLTFYIGIPLFTGYLCRLFEKDIFAPAFRVYQILGLFFSLFLFFPPRVFNTTVTFYEMITGLFVLYMLYVIARAWSKHRAGSRTTMIGILIFLCFGVNEILHTMGIINTYNSLSLGLVIFLFTQAILLAMRFSKAFEDSEILGENLATTNESLRRFIPQEFFHLLQRKEIKDIRLGDQVQKKMSILFSDIRSFTTLAESMGAEQTFEFLNDYFGRVGKVIRENGGFVDKYLGDGLIALFQGRPEDALNTAVGIQKAIQVLNNERAERGLVPVDVGIGINYGQLILGTVGEVNRMDTTVIADSVNLCSRLEGLTKIYGKGTIVPFTFLDLLEDPNTIHWRYLGLVRVLGRKQPVEIVHVYDGLSPDEFNMFHSHKEEFEEAISLYRNGDHLEALGKFRKLAIYTPDDPACFTFLNQIQRLINSGLANDWDGVESIPTK